MSENKNKDLLKTSLCFRKLKDENLRGEFFIIEEVCQGRITKINDHLMQISNNGKIVEITRMCNSMDAEGKTPLFYA